MKYWRTCCSSVEILSSLFAFVSASLPLLCIAWNFINLKQSLLLERLSWICIVGKTFLKTKKKMLIA